MGEQCLFKYYLKSNPCRGILQISVFFNVTGLHLWWYNYSVLDINYPQEGLNTIREYTYKRPRQKLIKKEIKQRKKTGRGKNMWVVFRLIINAIRIISIIFKDIVYLELFCNVLHHTDMPL